MIFEIIGNIGVVCALLAFFLLQKEVIKSDSFYYLGLNLIAGSLIIVSLLDKWNLPSFLLEFAWVLISLYGISRTVRKRMKAKA